MMRSLIVIIISCLLAINVFGQDDQYKNKIRVSGQVLTGDSLKPVPFANIRVRSGKLTGVSDFTGAFNFNASSSDTITISSIGFKNITFVIPDSIYSNFNLDHLVLYPDTTQLMEVIIQGWPSLESFRQDFINKSIPDNYYILAMKNLVCSELNNYAQNLVMDGDMNCNYVMEQVQRKYYYSGQIIPYTIFDIDRWKEFIEAMIDKR